MKSRFDLTKNIGSLSKIIDLEKGIIKKSTETERLRVFMEYLIENIKTETIICKELIVMLCKLDKALASEINGKHLINENTGKRYQSIGSESHYDIILKHAVEKLSLQYEQNMILDKNILKKISHIIWH